MPKRYFEPVSRTPEEYGRSVRLHVRRQARLVQLLGQSILSTMNDNLYWALLNIEFATKGEEYAIWRFLHGEWGMPLDAYEYMVKEVEKIKY